MGRCAQRSLRRAVRSADASRALKHGWAESNKTFTLLFGRESPRSIIAAKRGFRMDVLLAILVCGVIIGAFVYYAERSA
jgi:hypothetical protein